MALTRVILHWFLFQIYFPVMTGLFSVPIPFQVGVTVYRCKYSNSRSILIDIIRFRTSFKDLITE
jgi:hypothetical protein